MQHLRQRFLILLIGFIFLFPSNSEAHPGARDELGGHFQRSDCVYHLHNPTELAKKAKNMPELIELIKKYNNNSGCSSGLNEDQIDLEGYSFPTDSQQTKQETPVSSNKNTKQTNPEGNLKLGQQYPAELVKCVDGDTAHFNIKGKTYKTRFLYIDTPESTNRIEPFGKEASEYTCSFLKQGEIILETDGNALFDKYDRLLAWVWVDGKLQQEEITKAGLVKGFYDYGNYLYEERIISAMEEAKSSGRGMYATEQKDKSSTERTEKQKNKETETNPNSNGKDYQSIGSGIIILIVISLLLSILKRKKGKR